MLLPAICVSLLVPQGDTATGAVAFAQACLDATCDAVILNIAAHPDDEAARTTVMWRHAYGARTVTLYSTCGDGGQNAIGRDIGDRLAGIRIRETIAAAKHSGTEVKWLGFADFGYSKTREETLAAWGGEQELLQRMAAQVDAIRPDLVFTNHGLLRGHGHHRASSWAIREIAGERGLPLFERVFEGVATVEFDPGEFDSARGMTYAAQAHNGWREHRTQGPWGAHDPARVRTDKWTPVNAAGKALKLPLPENLPSVFDEPTFVAAVAKTRFDLADIKRLFDAFGADRARGEYVAIARELLPLMRRLRDGLEVADAARQRLERRIDALQRVVIIGTGVTFDARLAASNVTRGEPATVRAVLRGSPKFEVRCAEGDPIAGADGVAECTFGVPNGLPDGDPAARLTASVSVPVRAEFEIDGLPLSIERRIEVPLGPALRVDWPRPALFVPAGVSWERVASLEVESFTADGVEHALTFRAPDGVQVEAIPATVKLTPEQPRARVFVRMRGDGATAQRFVLRARVGDAAPARIDVQPLEAAALRELRIALVRGPDDTLERFLADLGVDYVALDETELAIADFADYTTLVLDIRAYHHRPDLARHRDRILEFNRGGGRVVVFYHKSREWNARDGKPLLAPLELTVGNKRVSEEDAAVEIIDAKHPLMAQPFSIGATDFEGWVQERGLNFVEKWDPEWTTVLRMHDAGEKPLEGSLLITLNGAGDYVYCALALYRQLRVGHLGAARLMVNLLTP